MTDGRIEVLNPNTPGRSQTVSRAKYLAMRDAMMAALPGTAPGLTADSLKSACLPHLPEDLFPGGATAGWWLKCVQLDLEARHVITREASKPLRWHRLP